MFSLVFLVSGYVIISSFDVDDRFTNLSLFTSVIFSAFSAKNSFSSSLSNAYLDGEKGRRPPCAVKNDIEIMSNLFRYIFIVNFDKELGKLSA